MPISHTTVLAVLAVLIVVGAVIFYLSRRGDVRLRGVALQLVLALMLCTFSSAQPLLMEYAKVRNGGNVPFHTPSIVFYTESLKVVVAAGVYAVQFPKLECP